MDKNNLGSFGEDAAAAFLKQKGYLVIERNFSCRQGEIDIVASEGEYLAFVEVKLRKDASHGEAREFVTRVKQKRVILAARYWLSRTPSDLQPRFDVVEVYAPAGPQGKLYFRLIRDAFY
jgi:putative endonuclease